MKRAEVFVLMLLFLLLFFFSSRRRHTRCSGVSWARKCVKKTSIGDNLTIEDLKAALSEKLSELATATGPAGFRNKNPTPPQKILIPKKKNCPLYTTDAADKNIDTSNGGRPILKKKTSKIHTNKQHTSLIYDTNK